MERFHLRDTLGYACFFAHFEEAAFFEEFAGNDRHSFGVGGGEDIGELKDPLSIKRRRSVSESWKEETSRASTQ